MPKFAMAMAVAAVFAVAADVSAAPTKKKKTGAPSTAAPTAPTTAAPSAHPTTVPTGKPTTLAPTAPLVAEWEPFYTATNGAKWTACSNDFATPCSCKHVTCNAKGKTILGLSLAGLGLSGTVPDAILNSFIAAGVTSIDISNNPSLVPAGGLSCVWVPNCLNKGVTCKFNTGVTQCPSAPTAGPTSAPIHAASQAPSSAPSKSAVTSAPVAAPSTAAPSSAPTKAVTTISTTLAPSTAGTTSAPSTSSATAAPSTASTTAAPSTAGTVAPTVTSSSPTATPTLKPTPKPTFKKGDASVASVASAAVAAGCLATAALVAA